jgi:hypothetical protein
VKLLISKQLAQPKEEVDVLLHEKTIAFFIAFFGFSIAFFQKG